MMARVPNRLSGNEREETGGCHDARFIELPSTNGPVIVNTNVT